MYCPGFVIPPQLSATKNCRDCEGAEPRKVLSEVYSKWISHTLQDHTGMFRWNVGEHHEKAPKNGEPRGRCSAITTIPAEDSEARDGRGVWNGGCGQHICRKSADCLRPLASGGCTL